MTICGVWFCEIAVVVLVDGVPRVLGLVLGVFVLRHDFGFQVTSEQRCSCWRRLEQGLKARLSW